MMQYTFFRMISKTYCQTDRSPEDRMNNIYEDLKILQRNTSKAGARGQPRRLPSMVSKSYRESLQTLFQFQKYT